MSLHQRLVTVAYLVLHGRVLFLASCIQNIKQRRATVDCRLLPVTVLYFQGIEKTEKVRSQLSYTHAGHDN